MGDFMCPRSARGQGWSQLERSVEPVVGRRKGSRGLKGGNQLDSKGEPVVQRTAPLKKGALGPPCPRLDSIYCRGGQVLSRKRLLIWRKSR
jgi:hypothetical protein